MRPASLLEKYVSPKGGVDILEETHMIKKTITAVALAGAMTMAAAGAASAASYPAPDSALSCSAATVPTGTVFTCTVGGPDDAAAELCATTSGANAAIAGTVCFTKTVVSNVAAFTVTAPSTAGTVGFSATVTPVESVSYDTNTTSVAVTAAATGGLASTGADNTGLALGAGALLVAGAGAVVVAARRRASVNA